MSLDEQRTRAAGLLRQLGHEFVAREIDEATLTRLVDHVELLLEETRGAPARTRTLPAGSFEAFRMSVPGTREQRRSLFADSIVSGGANPMGLGAQLWREGDAAFTEVTLGRAFEGAPSRAHGGIVAALIDETMGLVLAIHEALAFTVQLDITYLAPTPLHVPIEARAWLERRDGRKMFMRASVSAEGVDIASATSLFITVDPTRFLAREG